MLDQCQAFLAKGPAYRAVIQAVYEHPYAEKKDAFKDLQLSGAELDAVLAELEEALVVLSLTSQASSNIESRVPKKIFLINPDLENDLGGLL